MMKDNFYLKKTFTFIFSMLCVLMFSQKKFKIVLDAGHGGHDDGTATSYSDLGSVVEKDIALNVTLMVGKLLEKDKHFQVIYTRKTDVYPTLTQRTNLANSSKADVFVSIHCNGASRKSAHGTETFVQGPDQNDTNLEVAKRENDIIFLDEEDKANFSSYNPNSPESLIALKIQQNKYLQKSLMLGGFIENNFTVKDKRFSRGVKQKNLHVLRLNAMPSVLIEIGFLSNYDDAKYLSSYAGQKEVAESIYNAISDYKKAIDRRGSSYSNENASKPKVEKKEMPLSNDYRILIMSSKTRYNDTSPSYKGLKYIFVIKENDVYKYYYSVTNLASIRDQNLKTAKDAGFRNAYPVGFIPNQKLKNSYYTIELEPTSEKLGSQDLKGLKNLKRKRNHGKYYYTYGHADTLEKAVYLQKQLEKMGFSNTVVEKIEK